MVGYVGLGDDVLDDCLDEQVSVWCSAHFGLIYECKQGPFDRRISKHLGSGKELPVDEGTLTFLDMGFNSKFIYEFNQTLIVFLPSVTKIQVLKKPTIYFVDGIVPFNVHHALTACSIQMTCLVL